MIIYIVSSVLVLLLLGYVKDEKRDIYLKV